MPLARKSESETPRARILNGIQMNSDKTAPAPRLTTAGWFGLFISLFGMLIVRQVVIAIWPSQDFFAVVIRESGMWLVAATLLLVTTRFEGLPLTSIGLGTARWPRSILWGFIIFVICMAVAVGLVAITGYTGGESGKKLDKLPLWLVTLIVSRAGVVEELCYRGYAIERLRTLGLPGWLAASIPLLIFGVGHWTGGWANIVIALALGGILAAVYLWRRDLVANMIGHFLVDFVANVLPRIFS